jgi:hypothetical protein
MEFTLDNVDVYMTMVIVCDKYGADVYMDGRRQFYDALIDRYDGPATLKDFKKWLNKEIPKHFKTMGKRPRWIQSAEWPFSKDGQPMVFMGQLDISITTKPLAAEYFHDDTTLYMFLPGGSEYEPIKVVLQQY